MSLGPPLVIKGGWTSRGEEGGESRILTPGSEALASQIEFLGPVVSQAPVSFLSSPGGWVGAQEVCVMGPPLWAAASPVSPLRVEEPDKKTDPRRNLINRCSFPAGLSEPAK